MRGVVGGVRALGRGRRDPDLKDPHHFAGSVIFSTDSDPDLNLANFLHPFLPHT